MAKVETKWFARGGGIAKCGPFKTQAAAWRAMRHTDKIREKTRYEHPADTAVWPEDQ